MAELRIHVAQGYRLYYCRRGETMIICCAEATNPPRRLTSGARKRWRKMYRRNSVSVELAPYDPADLLRTEEDIRAYLTAALNDDNPSVFVIALGEVVRIRGVGNVARQSGLDTRRLYAALSAHGNPQWETIHRILKRLDIHLQAAA